VVRRGEISQLGLRSHLEFGKVLCHAVRTFIRPSTRWPDALPVLYFLTPDGQATQLVIHSHIHLKSELLGRNCTHLHDLVGWYALAHVAKPDGFLQLMH
jgi:hypothetical protein